ncbi:MAG TPA: 4a-hydroxytetrahydrobiopterin dehydratase [Chloroflexota bacterium]|nr:4a-hydroxytetrahydrobiopterin dehydratase [Chloroflexota bacterium]
MALLTEDGIESALRSLPDWERAGDALRRAIRFPDFLAGIRFVNRVADIAEELDHHPDIDIRYRTVCFYLSSHDEGGLTERDIRLARRIDEALRGGEGHVG